jgi:hypothetical protein
MTLTGGNDLHDEWKFKKWYRDWAQRTGISRDPDHRDAKYDFRAAWRAKASPTWDEDTKTWTWPDEFSYEKPESPPAPRYELMLTINGVKMMAAEPTESASDGV